MKRFKIWVLIIALLLPSIKVQARTFIDNEAPVDVLFACDWYGKEYNICPELLQAICFQESRYTADIVDSTGTCCGLMQINVSSHKERMKRLGVTDIYDIYGNVHVGADYLAELFDEYEDVAVVLTIYHGEKNVSRAMKGNYSSYVKDILEKSEYLERLHGK